MPKYLPCSTCRQPALATKDGILHTAGRLSSPQIDYLCRRCGRTSKLSTREFAALPDMTAAEIEHASCDLPFSASNPVPVPAPIPTPDPKP